MLRRLVIPALLAAVSTVVLAAAPAGAAADPDVNEVVRALESEHVYVDPDADTLSSTDAGTLTQIAGNSETPVYIAVFPEGTFTSRTAAGSFAGQVQSEIGDGTYVIVSGTDLASDSTVLSDSAVDNAEAAAREQGTPVDGLNAYVQEINDEASAANASGVFGAVLLGVLALAVVGGGFFLYNSKKKREAKAAQELADIKKMAAEDVTRLGEDVAQLEIDLTKVDEETRRDYTHAMDSYDRAKTALDSIKRPEEIQQVTTALEDGRYFMTATRARLDGRPVPERRKPCFFNPQHGPSQQDVMWAPPGGAPRSVPACVTCSQAVLTGAHPDVRMVEVDGHRRPYYDAGPAYAPYAGGYFGMDMMMGMFTGMMIGNMMGSMMGASMMGAGMADMGAADAGAAADVGGGDEGFGGFGDFGGGGFEGGDFGGFGDF
ncbi:chemotaxis protein CheA [Marinactinospora rubrisoli]|uniref:Chemotaxis protein CheA n=1 Tax=Marinactinospora rubrisoli TaxID=2715399 RepID=A0ABW2KMV1_9ACTN